MIHQQFMESDYQRKRYWGRAMVGWKGFDQAQPNIGHMALAQLEQMGRLGVPVEDRLEFYEPQEHGEFYSSSGQQQVSIVTQNVDALHQRAGSKQVIRLHGAGDLVKCMNCGHVQNRNDFHTHLEQVNHDWLAHVRQGMDEQQLLLSSSSDKDDDDHHQNKNVMRPDGDAALRDDVVDYHHVQVPHCPKCRVGFFKPDVVFFGDTVPKHRVALCTHTVEAAEGILVVGTSLAVHSAYRHVRAASARGIPVVILNVGETRAEAEGLPHLLKVEAPAGDVLAGCVPQLGRLDERQRR
jgi:NAD+-dependent protein deacetylase sirtuin 4